MQYTYVRDVRVLLGPGRAVDHYSCFYMNVLLLCEVVDEVEAAAEE